VRGGKEGFFIYVSRGGKFANKDLHSWGLQGYIREGEKKDSGGKDRKAVKKPSKIGTVSLERA